MALSNKKPHILAVETSGRFGSVAIGQAEKLIAEIAFQKPLTHSAVIYPTIQLLLTKCKQKPKNIDHIYISIGPGSFTGLRIAVTLAKTMHLANKTKIVDVDTLDVIAQNANGTDTDRIATILDAKRGQFFIAVYERTKDKNSINSWNKICPGCLMTASEFIRRYSDPAKPVHLLGEGLVYYEDKFKAPGINIFEEALWYPKAANVHRLGFQLAQQEIFADPVSLVPNYLRKPDVKTK
jgi:tRNA threonylcarbamoyl adenosine modification protein YeaZ